MSASGRLSVLAVLFGILPCAWLDDPSDELTRLRALLERERAGWAEKEAGYRRRIADLEAELVRTSEDRLRREQEFLDFTRLLAAVAPQPRVPEAFDLLGGGARDEDPGRAAGGAGEEPGPADTDPQEAARREREREVFLGLRSLLVAEQVDGLELLEAGLLGEGWIGPVVLRTIDERGRPSGTLSADRLRLEGSRAARTLTIVLEGGYERRGGRCVPFAGTREGQERGGARRIELPAVDPRPWIEALPELFAIEAFEPSADDGRWSLSLVRHALNELLAGDVAGGSYRLAALGGVRDGVLRDVRLDQLDPEGRVERRLFADRLTLRRQAQGVLLLLEDGAQMRSDRKLPFLEGRYRVFLPGARPDDWQRAGLPGLSEPHDSPLAR